MSHDFSQFYQSTQLVCCFGKNAKNVNVIVILFSQSGVVSSVVIVWRSRTVIVLFLLYKSMLKWIPIRNDLSKEVPTREKDWLYSPAVEIPKVCANSHADVTILRCWHSLFCRYERGRSSCRTNGNLPRMQSILHSRRLPRNDRRWRVFCRCELVICVVDYPQGAWFS